MADDRAPPVGVQVSALSLPGDLLNIISTYTTTAVTFELITIPATNWRETYDNALWKRKLRYEVRDCLVDSAVIEANAGAGGSGSVWFRYYLAKNRTLWGSAMHTMGMCEKVTATPVELPGPVLAAGFVRFSNIRMIFQLADLSLVAPKKHGLLVNPVFERVREFILYTNLSGQTLAAITERGRVFDLGLKGLLCPTLIGEGDVVGLVRSPDGPLLLRRDGSLTLYETTTGKPKLIQPLTFVDSGKPTPKVIQLAGAKNPGVLFANGISAELNFGSRDGRIRANEAEAEEGKIIRYETEGGRRSELAGGFEFNVRWGFGNIAVRTDTFFEYRGLFQLGDRTTVSYDTASEEKKPIVPINLPTGHRTQFITGYQRQGIVILD